MYFVVFPMYKAYIEPDLQTAHIKIQNKFNPFSGFLNPTYILKSSRTSTEHQIKAMMSANHAETIEETYDIYLLPPGEDPEVCQSYLRMQNKDGKYSLMFEEWVIDNPFIISPRITFEVSVRLLGGLMALGYTIATKLKRQSRVFSDDRVCIKMDWLEQQDQKYLQVEGKDRTIVRDVAKQLGLEGSYIPRTYIEQILLEKLLKEPEVMALPEDLKTKLSIDEDVVSSLQDSYRGTHMQNLDANKNYSKSVSDSSAPAQREIRMAKLTGFNVNNKSFDDRVPDSPASSSGNQVILTQLSQQMSALNGRLDSLSNLLHEKLDHHNQQGRKEKQFEKINVGYVKFVAGSFALLLVIGGVSTMLLQTFRKH